MAAVFNLTAAMDKTPYSAGDTMTVNVTGTVINPGVATTDTLSVNVQAEDGSTDTLSTTATIDASVPETWQIVSVTDTGGRTWTISADGHSASATA